jgi:hypothetical protein
MKALALALLMIATAVTGGAAQSARPEGTPDAARPTMQQTITFDDIAPRGMVLKQCWNAMGMDRQERVYIGFTASRADGREDFAVFRYDPATGDRRFLGSFMGVSEAAGNLQAREEIPKGHTHFVELQGRMYMASQGFHDFKGAIDTLPRYRGSHLYAYDIAADRFEEASRPLPGGVATQHTGIIALAAVPGTSLLAGLEHPSSNIILFDASRGLAPKVVAGIPWREGNPLSREIVATKQAKIYTYRGTEEPAQRAQSHRVWVHDLKAGTNQPTPQSATGGFWNGQSASRDGESIFLSTVNGELYRLDTRAGRFTHLGHFLPRAELEGGERIDQLYGITLSMDERLIYGVPRRSRAKDAHLYAYEIATGTVTLLAKLEPAIYTGSHMRDSRGNIYFGRFGDGHSSEGKAALVVLHPA